MKSDEIKNLFSQFEAAASEFEGIECWSARELQELLGYSKWENFEKVIQKAKDACNNVGERDNCHFPDIRKTIPMPKGAEKEIDDILLTRYACYLIAQNGDSRKKTIALAQTYFAFQTRKMEITEREYSSLTEDEKRFYQRNLTKKGNYSLKIQNYFFYVVPFLKHDIYSLQFYYLVFQIDVLLILMFLDLKVV